MSKGRQPVITKEQIPYIAEEYKRGRGMQSLAEELGVCISTINNYLISANVERRRKGTPTLMTEDLIDIAAEMRSKGIPWKLVERKVGIAQSTLDRALRNRKREHEKMPAKKFNEEQTAYIVAQYQRGRSSHCIAREMGVTMQTILIYLESNKVVRRVAGARKVVTPEIVETAKAMRAEGSKWGYIEKRVGVSRETLRQAIIRMNAGKEV